MFLLGHISVDYNINTHNQNMLTNGHHLNKLPSWILLTFLTDLRSPLNMRSMMADISDIFTVYIGEALNILRIFYLWLLIKENHHCVQLQFDNLFSNRIRHNYEFLVLK